MSLAFGLLSRPRLQVTRHQIARSMASTILRNSLPPAPVENLIRTKLEVGFSSHNFLYLEIVNESYKHNVPEGAESHFNVLVVSDAFEGVYVSKN